MAINLSNLGNVTPFQLNTTIISEGQTKIIDNVVQNANTVSEGYLGLVVLTLIFLVLAYEFYRNDGDFRLDTARAILKASGWTFLLGITLVVSDLIGDFKPVVWFGIIWLVSGISILFLKRKNL